VPNRPIEYFARKQITASLKTNVLRQEEKKADKSISAKRFLNSAKRKIG